ncbi:MAG: potassium channel family protein [Vicinamibacteria bacterium]|nr:potassium channel family protein [Vicinamibacteria bacterium]
MTTKLFPALDTARQKLDRARALWARLRAENVPHLVAYFGTILVVGGALMLWIEKDKNPAFHNLEDGLWWALVTLTTIGYGDKYPITTLGHAVGAVVVVFGVGMVGVVTAKIATILVEDRIKEARGLNDASRLTGHVVVLGWKPDMHLLVDEMLRVNPRLKASHLVLVNLADEVQGEQLRDRFPGLMVLHGDVVDPLVLRRANLAHAVKVILLADESGDRGAEEIDARTVMAAMTVSSMAPGVYKCAEILDRKYAEHLKLARCDEVILSREYSRFLLVSSTVSEGIAHVLHDLIDVSDDCGLATVAVPPEFVGRTFGELATHLRGHGRMLIGLLQDTGRASEIKQEALRDAQKTADIATLVENLRRVKQLEPNRPLLNPPEGHVIERHSLAITIGRTRPDPV